MRKVLLGAALVVAGGAIAPAAVRAQSVLYDPANDRSYIVNGTSLTWNDAEAAAVSAGRHLVSVGSAAENDLINALVGDGWIGLTDNEAFGGSEAGTNPNGNWRWTDGTPFSYQNF